MVRNHFFLDSAKPLSIGKCCPRPTPSGITGSSRSTLSIWFPSHNGYALRESSSFTGDSMPLTPPRLTSACLSSPGPSSEARSQVSRFTRRSILPRSCRYSTGSPTRSFMMSMRWTGSHMSRMPAMYLTGDTLTWQGCTRSTSRGHSMSFVKKTNPDMKSLGVRTSLRERTTCCATRLSGSPEKGTRATIRVSSGASFTTRRNCVAPSRTTRTTSISRQRISPCCTGTAGRLSFSFMISLLLCKVKV